MKWTKIWPTKLGFYWFYGKQFGDGQPGFALIECFQISNGTLIKGDGFIWYKEQGHVGVFAPAVLPEIPKNITFGVIGLL